MARRDVIEARINKLGSRFGDYVQVYDDRVRCPCWPLA